MKCKLPKNQNGAKMSLLVKTSQKKCLNRWLDVEHETCREHDRTHMMSLLYHLRNATFSKVSANRKRVACYYSSSQPTLFYFSAVSLAPPSKRWLCSVKKKEAYVPFMQSQQLPLGGSTNPHAEAMLLCGFQPNGGHLREKLWSSKGVREHSASKAVKHPSGEGGMWALRRVSPVPR